MHLPENDRQELMMHLHEHMLYPASKAQIIEACNYMAHVPKATVEWFEKTLPDKTYNNADEVHEVLHAALEHSH